MNNATEIRELIQSLKVLRTHLNKLETDANYPDTTERLIAAHQAEIDKHQRAITTLRENSKPKPERIDALRRGIQQSERRLGMLKNQGRIDRLLRMQRDIDQLSKDV